MNKTNVRINLFGKRIFLGILMLITLYFAKNLYADVEEEDTYKVSTVVIDPGHGGRDSGAKGSYSLEKDVVLAISLKLGKLIEVKLPEVKVIYTRTIDDFIPLHKRADIANKNNADLFISIHANGWANSSSYGTETLVLGLHRTDENFEVAKQENSVILLEDDYNTTYAGFDPNSPESYIIFSLMQNLYLDQSINFAALVQDQFRNRAKRKDRGVKQQGLLVLARTSMPGVLVETGFISNKEEEDYLNSELGQDYIASAIFRAFRDYKNLIEENTAIGTKRSNDTLSVVETTIQNSTYARVSKSRNDSINTLALESSTANSEINATNSHTVPKSNICFKVQISASNSAIPANSDFFQAFENIEAYKTEKGYKYLVGTSNTYIDIVEYSKTVRNKFPDAFIIAFKNGEIIPLIQAIKESSN